MNIFFAIDKNYFPYLYTCINSILVNSDDGDEFNFYIMQNDFTDYEKSIIARLKKIRDFNINYVNIDENQIKSFRKDGYHLPLTTFYRYLIVDMFPSMDKALYMDVDIIVKKSLKDLWNSSFDGKYLGVIEDFFYFDNYEHKKYLGLSSNHKYFNAGVLFMNLEKIREDSMITKLFNVSIEKKDFFIQGDQDALNSVFNGMVKYVGYIYNFQTKNIINPSIDFMQYYDDVVVEHNASRDKRVLQNIKYLKYFPLILSIRFCSSYITYIVKTNINLWLQENFIMKILKRTLRVIKRLIRGELTFIDIVNKIKVKLYRKVGLFLPTQCSLFMSEICNFKCEGCRRAVVGHEKKGYLELDDVKLLLKKYPTIRSFTLAGLGEPTLAPDFVKIVDYLKSKKKIVTVITNGTNKDRLMEIKDKNVKISVSLYGLNNDMYQKYTKTSYFDKVIDSYKTIRESFKNVGLSYIVSRETYKDLEELVKLTDELSPNFLNLYNYLVYDPKNKEEMSKTVTINDNEILDYIENIRKDRGYISELPVVDWENDCYTCNSYNEVINFSPDGAIGGCRRQVPPSLKYGNLFKDNDPYNSVAMKELRDKIKNGGYPHDECKYCFGRFDNVKK